MMNLEEFLASLPKKGERIRFVRQPSWHWFTTIIEDSKLLEANKEYVVAECIPASSWTPIVLEEFPGKTFCWSSFEKTT